MRFSALTSITLLSLSLLTSATPTGLDTRAVSLESSVLPRDILQTRAAACANRKNRKASSSKKGPRSFEENLDNVLTRRGKTTQQEVWDAQDAYCDKVDEIEALKAEIAKLTPGSATVAAKKKELEKKNNAMVQLRTRMERLEDNLKNGRK